MTISDLSLLIGGIIAPIATVLYFILKEYKKKQLKNRKKLQGRWTNEGDVTSIEVNFVHLEITVDPEDGEIIGTVKAESFLQIGPKDTLDVTGKVNYNSAVLSIGRVSHQQYVMVAKAKITLTGKNIKWKILKADKEIKPRTTLMWNNDYSFYVA